MEIKKKLGGQRKGAGRPKGSGKYRESTELLRIPVSLMPVVEDLLSDFKTSSRDEGEATNRHEDKTNSRIYQPLVNNIKRHFPLYATRVSAGFPSPADDYIESKLDLNQYLVKHPAATFFVRVEGESMIGAGIYPNDVLVVDRSLKPADGKIVIAVVNGELTVKRLKIGSKTVVLLPENDRFPPMQITEEMNFSIWGVVTNVIHAV